MHTQNALEKFFLNLSEIYKKNSNHRTFMIKKVLKSRKNTYDKKGFLRKLIKI